MNLMNLGCGPDLKDGWLNVDNVYQEGIDVWDVRAKAVPQYLDQFDFVLVNHVLCTMNHIDVDKALDNIYEVLKPGGKVQIIDLDLILAFAYYSQGAEDMIPASGISLDHKFVNHISGFGTRKSLYTQPFMIELLAAHGYRNIEILGFSEYDLRPNESLIVEAMR